MAGADERVTLTVTQTLPAPPDAVFRGFSDPETFKQWFMSDWGEEITADFKAGGRYELKGETPRGTAVRCEGEFVAIEPASRVCLTFQWHGDPAVPSSCVPETWPQQIEVTLRAKGDDDTEVTFVHKDVASDKSAESHKTAWEVSLSMLGDLASAGAE